MTTLACDVGGTSIKLGLVRSGRLLARGEIPAKAQRGLADALQRIFRRSKTLLHEAGLKKRELSGFALSFPGIIEPLKERILSTPAGKFDDAKDIDVSSRVRRELGAPSLVCNDANAALAGEWRYGAARGCNSAVMMTLGTGIGTATIIEGQPLRGTHGQAGCLGGHWTVNLEGRTCLCGNFGCSESEASTWALPTLARAKSEFHASGLARAKPLDFAALFRLAGRGDALARELREHCLRVWGATLVSLIHAYDPECAVIGGGVMRSGQIILPALRRYVARHAWTPWGRVKIKAAALGNDAGMLGAAWLLESRS